MIPLPLSARRALALAAGLGLAVAAGGCARLGSVTAEVSTAIDNTVPMPSVTTEVLDAGAAPRTRLDRPALPGPSRRVTLVVHRDMLQQVGDQPQEHFLTPDVTIPLTATATADGIDVVVGAATASEPGLAAKLAAASGTRARLNTDAAGTITGFRLTASPGLTTDARVALEHSLDQAILQQLVFPDAPIGVGAVWLIHRQLPGRIAVAQTTKATLLSTAGGVTRVAVTVEQRPAQTAAVLGSAVRADITPAAADPVRGNGVFVVDRRLPLPVSADVSINGDHLYHDSSGAMRLRQTTAVRVTWGP